MKKLLLTILSIGSISAFAQRSADLSVRIAEPISGSQVTHAQPFALKMWIKNNGPDQLNAEDTVITGFGVGTGQVQIPTNTLALHTHGVVNVGDSFEITRNITATLAPGTNTSASFCVLLVVTNRAAAPMLDPSTNNNTNCVSINLFNSVEMMQQVSKSVKVYPNPARNFLNIEIDYKDAFTINVYDITGKLVETVNGSNGMNRIDVANYKKGFYIYEIRTEGNDLIKNGKFNVSY